MMNVIIIIIIIITMVIIIYMWYIAHVGVGNRHVPHTTVVPSTGKGQMLEELINSLDEDDSSANGSGGRTGGGGRGEGEGRLSSQGSDALSEVVADGACPPFKCDLAFD
jgi:hypothetical protein